jgi:hypothetical protein
VLFVMFIRLWISSQENSSLSKYELQENINISLGN